MISPQCLIVIPTYNEVENIGSLIDEILKVDEKFDILVVDDNSPDGTGELVDEISKQNRQVKVLHRPMRLGMGTAYIEGFKYGLKNGYEAVFEMDADFSHSPEYLPQLLDSLQDADVVIGSRYIPKGGIRNWSGRRLFQSKLANFYVRLITRLRVKDCTAGYKCFKRKVLESLDLDKIHSEGYAFQIETVYRAFRNGFRILEIPIIFTDRRAGKSKLTGKLILEAAVMPWRLRFCKDYGR